MSSKPMLAISPAEASALARVAENPGIAEERLLRMLAGASPDVAAMARTIIEVARKRAAGEFREDVASPAESVAYDMIKWADRNREQRAAFRKPPPPVTQS